MSLPVRVFFALLLLLVKAEAFSLLGPYADWMDKNKSYQWPGDIGGPMNIGEGYRWNVPVITYGFERSFLDYFGSNGVAAVESAIQTLNQLPSASQINLQNYPLEPWRINYQGQALGLLDLKSAALSLLLEQMGLASPERYAFCVRDFSPAGSNYMFFVVYRNFDSGTAQPSPYVNDNLFSYSVAKYTPFPTTTNAFCDAVEMLVDPMANSSSTVASFNPAPGSYANTLSRDDVGGLKYLLDGNQVRYESLLADIHSSTTNVNLVRSAWRPGIAKVTLIRHPAGALSGEFRPFTNQWTDVYYAGDYPAYQPVERVTAQPDILFTARDLGTSTLCTRTGTTNWVNNAGLNGNAGGSGPGVIQPGILLAFNNTGPMYMNQSPDLMSEENGYFIHSWGSFDGSTNPVVNYPVAQSSFQPTQIRFKLVVGMRTNEFRYLLSGEANARFQFQTSTNLASWTTLTTLTNSGASFTYTFLALTDESCRFFRTMLEP